MEQGINVYDLGIAPTPVLFRESRKYSGSIMITASHNPLEWNGLKLLVKGRGLFEKELDDVLKNTVNTYKSAGKYYDLNSSYFNDLINYIPINNNNRNDDFKIGLDFGGGVMWLC